MKNANPGAGPGLVTYRRIVVGVDDSLGGMAALQRAVGMARDSSVPLVAVRSWGLGLPRHGGRRHRRPGSDHGHVVLFFDGTEQRDEAVMLIRHAFRNATGGVPRDVEVRMQTPEGDPGRVLTGMATTAADVLVVGTENDQPLKRVVHGSVSRYCRAHARCPVVVVPPPGTTA